MVNSDLLMLINLSLQLRLAKKIDCIKQDKLAFACLELALDEIESKIDILEKATKC